MVLGKDEERDAIYKDYDDYVSWKLDEGEATRSSAGPAEREREGGGGKRSYGEGEIRNVRLMR